MAARKVHRVVRKAPKRTVHRGASSKRSTIKKSTAPPKKSKSFQLIPKAHAAGPALGLAGAIGKQVVKKLKPLPGVKNLGPSRNKTIKSVTYKNQIEGPIMKKTGGGVPLYKGYDKIPPVYATTQSGKIDTRLLDLAGVKRLNVSASTRANQAMMSSGPGSAKHTIKKKSFVKINKGGPVMEFLGGAQTRYKKRELRTVATQGTLVKGQDPTTPKSGLDKFTAITPAIVATSTVPFWDQIGNFFNPFPEAHAMPGVTTLARAAGQLLQKNVKLSWNQFRNQEGIANTAANKAEFQKVKDAFVKGKNQIQTSANWKGGGQAGAGQGGKIVRKTGWLKGGAVGVGSLATIGIVTNPEVNQWYSDATGAGWNVGPGGTSTHTEQEVVPPIVDESVATDVIPVIPYGTEGSTQTMQDAQSAYELGLITAASAAGPAPGIRYGLPGEQGMKDPNYTKITYKKWDGKTFVEASQYVKLGMTGMTATAMSAALTRQATKGQVNTVHAVVMGNIREKTLAATKAGKDPLKAAADAAKVQYAGSVKVGGTEIKVATLLGPLPRQYQDILNRDVKKEDAGKYNRALLWQSGGPYTQGAVRDDGTYPVTITPGGKDNPNFLKKPKDKIE